MNEPFDAPGEFERLHVRPRAGRTLIVGSRVYVGREDRRTRYPVCIGVDMLPGIGADVVANLEEPQPSLGLFDHVECCSVLEHSRRPWLLATNLEALMQPGATLHVAVPFVWRQHLYPDDLWRFTPEGIRALFPRIVWSALMFGNRKLYSEGKVPTMKAADGLPYFGRTETFGFGVRT